MSSNPENEQSKQRERGRYPAGFRKQSGGRLYSFEREREWEKENR